MLPVVDLTPLLSSDTKARRRIVAEIGAAFETSGFFYVRNHGVPQTAIDAALLASRLFFDLPEQCKRTSSRERGHYRGYISTLHRVHPPIGQERYSIAYFAHPDYDTLIKPLPGIPAMSGVGVPPIARHPD